MLCAQCGSEMVELEGMHRYEECGLSNVMLMNIPMYKCTSCRETDVEIPCMEELHLLIGFLLCLKPVKLTSEEARYLRKHMGYTQEELANHLGVSRVTVNRWETVRALNLSQDKALRRVYFQKKAEELRKLPEAHRILATLVDKLPLSSQKPKLQLRKEDWMSEAVPA